MLDEAVPHSSRYSLTLAAAQGAERPRGIQVVAAGRSHRRADPAAAPRAARQRQPAHRRAAPRPHRRRRHDRAEARARQLHGRTDRPVAFGGKAYRGRRSWRWLPGKDTVLDLTAKNAEIETATAAAPDAVAAAPVEANSAVLLATWHDSVVEIWTPTRHAEGFVIDSRGADRDEPQRAQRRDVRGSRDQDAHGTFKVPGTVIVDDRATGGAVIWIDPEAIGSIPPDRPALWRRGSCRRRNTRTSSRTITASMLSGKEVADGMVTRVTSQAIFADLRIGARRRAGRSSPRTASWSASARSRRIQNRSTRNEAWVVPLERACEAVAMTAKAMAGAAPPNGTRLPVETASAARRQFRGRLAKQPKAQLTTLQAANFDIALLTSDAGARGEHRIRSAIGFRQLDGLRPLRAAGAAGPRQPAVRGEHLEDAGAGRRGDARREPAAAQELHGELPPAARLLRRRGSARRSIRSSSSTRSPARSPIREGLYVFELGAFGPHCSTVRFSMFSEKDPQQADTKVIDPKLFEQLAEALNCGVIDLAAGGSADIQYRAGMTEPVIVPRAEHPISRRDIDSDALKVLYRLHESGATAYLVGGSVRDLLLSRRPKDFDIGTSAHPYQVKKLFRNCWIIGRRFRLAHVRFGLKTIEVATFRKNVPAGTEASRARTRARRASRSARRPRRRRRSCTASSTTTPSARPKRMPSAATSRSTRCSTTSPLSRSSTTSAGCRT